MVKKRRSAKLNLRSFSFFFLFKSCRKNSKNKDTLITDSDVDNSITKESKTSIFVSPAIDVSKPHKRNCDVRDQTKTALLRNRAHSDSNESGRMTKNEKRQTLNKNSNNNKARRNLNFKFSPRKNRNSFSPSKDAPLNCHVTVNLAQPYDNSEETGDKEYVLQTSKMDPTPKSDLKVSFKDEDKIKHKIDRSESLTENETFLQRRQKLSQKLPSLTDSKFARQNIAHSNQKFSKSVGNLNSKEPMKSAEFSLKTKQPKASRTISLNDEIMPDAKTKKTQKQDFATKIDAANLDSSTQGRLHHDHNLYSSVGRKGTNISNQEAKPKVNRSNVQLRSQHSRTQQRQDRPFSMIEGADDSNYVMLNPVPPVLKNTVKPQNRYWKEYTPTTHRNQRYETKTAEMFPAKSYDNLGSTGLKKYSYSKWSTGQHESFNDSELYSSPAIDYAAKVDDLLVQLRKSLNKNPAQRSFASSAQEHHFTYSMFPMKKSKSLEPIMAHAQQAQASDCLNSHRYSQTSRSRSRVKNIAKKYNMYTSNENLPSLSFNSAWDSKPCHSSAGSGYDDYVYLNPIPNPSPSHTENFHANVAANQPFCLSPEEPYLMSSSTGNYYHLNLYVQNARSTPDGAESTPHLYGSEISENSGSGYSGRESTCKPQVFYSLDV